MKMNILKYFGYFALGLGIGIMGRLPFSKEELTSLELISFLLIIIGSMLLSVEVD